MGNSAKGWASDKAIRAIVVAILGFAILANLLAVGLVLGNLVFKLIEWTFK